MELKTRDHPEADGRKAQADEVAWIVNLPLEGEESLLLKISKKSRDMLFGMMIADCHDHNEEEPA